MSDRSPVARDRRSLAQIHHKAQIATCFAASIFIALTLASPGFAHAAGHAFRALIALILN